MTKKATPNIDFMLSQAKAYADGTGYDLGFELDYGYELEKRYDKMVKENPTIAALIYDRLVREGSDYATCEKTEDLRKRIRREYDYVMSVYKNL